MTMMKTKQKLETMITRRLSDAELRQIEAVESAGQPEPETKSAHYIKPIWRIALSLAHCKVRIIADLRQPMQLGRGGGSTSEDSVTLIDLGLFNAYERGVSRSHATLSLTDSRVVLLDNNSANGTLLNGHRLKPMKAYPLQNGDVIQLADLEIRFDLLFNPYQEEVC